MKVTIYHNPRCSKSRQTLELLRGRNIEPEIIEYLKNPPDKAALAQILDALGKGPRELMRRKEARYAELNLDDPTLSDTQLIEIMVANPILIERPVVVASGRAAVGRPPEAVLEIL
jgi:arsenate reductase